MKAQLHKSTYRLALWTGAWVLSVALATFGPKFLWEGAAFWSAAAIALNLLVGLGMILANRNLFNRLDELQRKIQLEALAVTLGLAVVFGLAFSMLDIANLIQSDAEIGFLVGFIGITYLLATLINTRRYL